jgi:hypothetical protein
MKCWGVEVRGAVPAFGWVEVCMDPRSAFLLN